MAWVALAIFASTVLLLVDKNAVWPTFWRISKFTAAALLAIAITGSAIYYAYSQHEDAKAASQVTITPDH